MISTNDVDCLFHFSVGTAFLTTASESSVEPSLLSACLGLSPIMFYTLVVNIMAFHTDQIKILTEGGPNY